MSAECPVAIDGDDQETDEGQKEGYVDGGQSEDVLIQVDNRCLKRREHGTAEDGHDESCATKLHIIPQPAQGDAIDGGKHQRHAGTDKHQTIDTVTVGKEDDSAHRRHRSDGKYRKQPARLQILQQPRADKPAAAEQHHGDNVVLLREYLSCLFLHALCHEDTCAILDNKGPAHHLRAYIEELGDDSLSVILDREYMLQRYPNATASMRVAVFRHLRKTDEQRHDDDDDADGDIGLDKDVEVGALDEIKLCGGEFGAGGSVQGTEARLDIVHRHIHAHQRTDGIERLRQIQSERSRFLTAHHIDEGIAAGFEKRQSAGHNKVCQQKRIIHPAHAGGEEEECASGIKREPQQDTSLVRIPLDEQCSRECHHEITAIKCHLHHGAVGDTHAENL